MRAGNKRLYVLSAAGLLKYVHLLLPPGIKGLNALLWQVNTSLTGKNYTCLHVLIINQIELIKMISDVDSHIVFSSMGGSNILIFLMNRQLRRIHKNLPHAQ